MTRWLLRIALVLNVVSSVVCAYHRHWLQAFANLSCALALVLMLIDEAAREKWRGGW